ncbi:hypothetical protein J3F83DRAFT_752823 [Trichoderma novae-zelandiae]
MSRKSRGPNLGDPRHPSLRQRNPQRLIPSSKTDRDLPQDSVSIPYNYFSSTLSLLLGCYLGDYA